MTGRWITCFFIPATIFLLISLSTAQPVTDRQDRQMFDFMMSRNTVPDVTADTSINSPIYYIRMPPMPYSFIPGMGYISQMPPMSMNPSVVNLPLPFFGNGKPVTVYQWNGGFNGFSNTQPKPPVHKPVQAQLPDSPIHHLPGKYTFNGKPNDIYILRDSYNKLYSDALQNIYP